MQHFHPEFTKHVGTSYTIARLNAFDTHAVAVVEVDGVASTVCYSHGTKITKRHNGYRPIGAAGTLSTLVKATRFCALLASGYAADFAFDLACCA